MSHNNNPVTNPDSLFEQLSNISKAHAYDILAEQVKELRVHNNRMKNALKSITHKKLNKMTKTKFSVEIHGKGLLNNELLSMIAHHNEGGTKIDLDVIRGWLTGQRSIYPETHKDLRLEDENGYGIRVYEGSKQTLTIVERTIHELEPDKLRPEANPSLIV